MGNTIKPCFSGHHHLSPAAVSFEPNPDDSIGHAFAYHPTQAGPATATVNIPTATINPTTGFSITGAAISANTSTPLSSCLTDSLISASPAASFESSRSFTSNVLQTRLSTSLSGHLSGPLSEAGSQYSERSYFSGPLDHARLSCSSLNSTTGARLQRSISQIIADRRADRRCRRSSRPLARLFSKLCRSKKVRAPTANGVSSYAQDSQRGCKEHTEDRSSVQWAQGRAGEDRVHVVVSEEHGWVFVGIYDGFNGPDATDFLQTHLYPSVHLELRKLFTDYHESGITTTEPDTNTNPNTNQESDCCSTNGYTNLTNVNRVLRTQLTGSHSSSCKIQHKQILNALSEALKKTEKAYFEMSDQMATQNPELAMMGSCVLVALLKGDHVYLMNVGDSRAVLAQKNEPDLCNLLNKGTCDTTICGEEIRRAFDVTELAGLTPKQLTSDHSTSIDEEVKRIEKAHPDDPKVVENDRVKGKLKVTRAFGAGFLKSPKWNDQVLGAFKIKNYVGNLPYITCLPGLFHHKIRPEDKFLVLSSDGLYQYFTNEDLVNEVNLFVAANPNGDPAQYLVEEVLHRAAAEYGMEFHELVSIPQGDRRRYHDDVSIIIISLEGRIWRSSM
ncbi:hypothetical protein LUZ63_007404 [Rhynchospora breviuscula]|uniref:protein-serine/threonine phosphatase n=1 Tax=Rhynchospora breviuscula TaxID=2022672 RepID=A0A9Q0HUC9_9POAL|nr:hypothetical protein LUZ63_007404 [Rhynchospora breviuscula]